MTTTIETSTPVAVLDGAATAEDRVRTASVRLFDAECALHAARQSHVDRWIAAASERLHDAVIDYRFVLATRGY